MVWKPMKPAAPVTNVGWLVNLLFVVCCWLEPRASGFNELNSVVSYFGRFVYWSFGQ